MIQEFQIRLNYRILLLLVLSALPIQLVAAISLPSPRTEIGFSAHLLINEAPFPGERAYVSEADTMQAMDSILNVLVARLAYVPEPYRQRDVAAVTTDNIFDIITAGGVRGQVDGFYRDSNGHLMVVSRVTERTDNLVRIANTGQPGRFARLLNHAVSVSSDFVRRSSVPYDPYSRLAVVDGIRVTGRAYSWMTDQSFYHPGGNFVRISDANQGAHGGNRFFTLRSNPK